jgi:hypothetical protein
MNLAVAQGVVVGAVTRRDTEVGSSLSFDVRTSSTLGSSTIPVRWTPRSTTKSAHVAEGDQVTVVGSVQRRFFRSAGSTQSRTELVASTVVRGERAARRAIDAALAGLAG